MQKLYCYVDETGQDIQSEIFVVVAIISADEQEKLRQKLLEIENYAKIGQRKWHKSQSDRRINYLALVLEAGVAEGDVYFGCYKKPLPYFLPLLEVLEKSIKKKTIEQYRAIVCVDGIDRKKAVELTNALRLRGVSLALVKGKRDESEPIIRLADRWAGCIRGALSYKVPENRLLVQAKNKHYLTDLTK